MSSKKPNKEELFDAHLNRLTGPRGQEVHQMIDNDPEIKAIIDDYKKIEELYQKTSISTPQSKTLDAILKHAETSNAPKKSLNFFFKYQKALGLAVALVFVATLGVIIDPKPQMDPASIAVDTETASRDEGFIEINTPAAEESAHEAHAINDDIKLKKEKITSTPVPIKPSGSSTGGLVKTVAVAPMASRTSRSILDLTPDQKHDLWIKDQIKKAFFLEYKKEFSQAIGMYKDTFAKAKAKDQKEDILFRWAFCLEKIGDRKEALRKLFSLQEMNAFYPGLNQAINRLRKQ